MGKGKFWLHPAVAVAYILTYTLLRKIGFAHFAPVIGFKLSVLLLVPRRYWPTLFISELGILSYTLHPCIEQFGLPFYIAAIVPPIGLLMPIVLLTRTYIGGLTLPHFRLSSVLTCVIACSAVLVIDGLAVEALIPNPDVVGRKPLAQLATDYFLGSYTGILSVMPMVLTIAMEWAQERSSRSIWQNNRELLTASAIMTLAVILEVMAVRVSADPMLRFGAQAVLFLPATYFALNWGWKGAAFAGCISSFAIAAMMPTKFDVGTLSSQTIMALLVTTFIVLGVQTTKLKRSLSISDNHLKKARLEQHLAEVKLQRSSFELSFVNVQLARAHRHLLIHLGDTYNRSEVDTHRDTLTQTTFRLNELADSLSPSMGAGHPHALTEGPISRLLGNLGVEYQPNIQGQLSALSKPTLALLYRLACEAVAYLLNEHASKRIVLVTQTETIQGKLTIRLTALSTGERMPSPSNEMVMKALGTYGLGLEELRTRAQLFNGDVVVDGPCVQVILNQDMTTIATM